ncbi:MAG: exonuclease SbcCD subunit D C-terminal domain-containing protein [Bacteroidales bacterium]|nr:exonuclease SbcCD subunit D C-terminal domain-containing protein [Bacteroidales bacterium]
MKILHTSDWHLGQEFHTYDRMPEHEAFLNSLEDMIRQEQPDALLVCGDIYHTSTPSNTVMRLFTDGMDRIRQACPSMRVIVSAGNHDSSSRLEVSRSLWGHLGVTVIGRVERDGEEIDFSRHLIELPERKGYVVALPHMFPQNYPAVSPDIPREDRQKSFMSALGDYVRLNCDPSLPLVMMAHLAIAGSDISGHDPSRGGMDYIGENEIDVPYDYLALGHIHFPQMIGTRARYCGSPIPISFDEDYPHSVTVAEVAKGEIPLIRTIPVRNIRPLRTIPKSPVSFEDALKALEGFPSDEPAYLRIWVRLEDVPPANAMLRASMALQGKQAKFCTIKWERNRAEESRNVRVLDVEQFRAFSPLQLAEMYYSEKYGGPLDEDLKRLMMEAIGDGSADMEEEI